MNEGRFRGHILGQHPLYHLHSLLTDLFFLIESSMTISYGISSDKSFCPFILGKCQFCGINMAYNYSNNSVKVSPIRR